MFKKVLATLLCLALVLALAACGSAPAETAAPAPAEAPAAEAPAAQPEVPAETSEEYDFSKDDHYKLAFSILLPPNNGVFEWMTPMFEEITEKTGGTVEFEVFAGGTLLAAPETWDGIQQGVADCGVLPSSYAMGTMPLTYFAAVPGTYYASAKAASYALREFLDVMQPAELENFKVLNCWCGGIGIYLSKGKDIATMDDFKGLQIRTDAPNADSITAYGAAPSLIGVAEVYEAMRQGVVDAYQGTPDAAIGFKLNEVTDYATLTRMFNNAFVFAISKPVWDSMSDAQRAVMEEVCNKYFESDACCFLERDWLQPTIDVLEAQGVEVKNFSEEDYAKMEEIAGALLQDYAAGLEAEYGIDGVAALKTYQDLVAKYNEMYPTSD